MPNLQYEPQVDMTPKGTGAVMPGGLPGLWTRGAGAATRAAVDAMGATQALWEQVGKAGDKLAAAGWEVNQRIRHDKQVDQFTSAHLNFMTGLYQLQDQVKGGTKEDGSQFEADPERWGGNFSSEANKLLEKTLADVQDPDVHRHLKQRWAAIIPAHLHEVLHEARTNQIQQGKATALENYEQGVQLYLQAQNDIQRGQIQSSVFSMLDEKGRRGVLHPDQVQTMKQKFGHLVMDGMVKKDIAADPVGAFHRLEEPEKYYPGLTPEQALHYRPMAHGEMNRVMEDHYAQKFTQVMQASGDKPTAAMPSESEIIADPNLSPAHKGRLRVIVRLDAQEKSEGRILKDDPDSLRAMAIADHDGKLTPAELIKNTDPKQGGTWRIGARTFAVKLKELDNRPQKLEKLGDSVLKSVVNRYKTAFGISPNGRIDPVDDYYFATAKAQIDEEQREGTLGKTPEEIKKKAESIFQEQYGQYKRDKSLEDQQQRERQQQKKESGFFNTAGNRQDWVGVTREIHQGAGGSKTGLETVTKDGRTYQVITVDGKKMVDPNPMGNKTHEPRPAGAEEVTPAPAAAPAKEAPGFETSYRRYERRPRPPGFSFLNK